MRYLSVCSGIEAASVAWGPLGWQAVAFSEIEPFPCAVLAHHYPDVPNLGDMTRFREWPNYAIDLLCGGTPCQSFSVAGLRKGLDDPRGNLMLTFGAIAAKYRPRWLVWENVPGVLSSNGGRDFGTFLGMLGQLGYGFAYRILDAQYFGVPQRRRRVFVVGYLGDWRRTAAVLFERHSMSGDSPPRREAREVAPTIPARSTGGGGLGTDFDRDGGLIARAVSLRGDGFDSSEDGTGRGTPLVPAVCAIQAGALRQNPNSGPDGVGVQADHAYTLEARAEVQAVAFNWQSGGDCRGLDPAETTNALHCGQTPAALYGAAVRCLTPRECERLMGFPDDYTLIPWRKKPASDCPDGPRYKALGNSWAVPVARWIGERINAVEQIKHERKAA